MDGWHVILIVLSGLVFCGLDSVTSMVLEKTVRPGDNITLYCDCKPSTGVYIVWFRNCSQENHPSLVLDYKENYLNWEKKFSRFKIEKNNSSDSYDLMITNITTSDEGLYYCGTEELRVEKNEVITSKTIYRYGNTTLKLSVTSIKCDPDRQRPLQDCDLCWKLLFSLVPIVFFSAFLSSFLVFLLCQKTAWKSQDGEKRHDLKRQTEETLGEDVCYAALEIRPASQRPKKKKTIQSSDFSTYSAINTSRE